MGSSGRISPEGGSGGGVAPGGASGRQPATARAMRRTQNTRMVGPPSGWFSLGGRGCSSDGSFPGHLKRDDAPAADPIGRELGGAALLEPQADGESIALQLVDALNRLALQVAFEDSQV